MSRVLIVEDNEQVAEFISGSLDSIGHKSDRTPTALGAIKLASIHVYDAILMDLVLQDTHGTVAALALRGIGYTGPIIFATAWPKLENEAERLLDLIGNTSRLIKPFKAQELLAEVDRQLDKARENGNGISNKER